MVYDPFKHHRRSIRLRGYDYRRAGAYYITVVTRNRECLYGDIVGGEMRLNEFGRAVTEEWLRTAQVRPNVELDAFVVMPNHLHGIVVITAEARGAADDVERLDPVGAPGDGGAQRRCAPTDERGGPPRESLDKRFSVPPGSLGAIVRAYKSQVTKRINTTRDTVGAPVWQWNYHEHIIRDDDDLNRIRAYIRDNPAQWESDTENPRKKAV